MIKKLSSISTVLLLIVFCGSGCGSDSSTAANISKREYVKQAKQICTDAESEQFKQGSAYLAKHPGVKEEQVLVEAALPPIEKELQKLKALGTPKGDESKVEAFLSALENAIAESRQNPAKAISSKSNPFAKSNKLAESYGLEGCSGNP